MRALLVMRPDAYARFGGDTVLAEQTARALGELGVDAQLVHSESPHPRGFDVVHLFNVGQPEVSERQFRACEAAPEVPVVLSPVWLDLREFLGRARIYENILARRSGSGRTERRLARARGVPAERLIGRRERIRLYLREQRQAALLRRARVLVPNSAIEARDCLLRLGVREVPLATAPLGADLEPAPYWKALRHGIVCVGRVETRKNQAMLLFALRDDDLEVDLVGASYEPRVVQACEYWCPRAKLHGSLPRAGVLEMLGRAEVHVLASWTETAGIASLEAAAAGAKLVVGDRGAEVEYFGEDAEYADPADPKSIRAAVYRALKRPARTPGDSLDRRLRTMTWRRCAERTLAAYNLALLRA